MPDGRRKTCRACGKNEAEVGAISWAGYCEEDGQAALRSNILQMHARKGPNFDRWRLAMAACVGGQLLDAPATGSHTTH